MRALAASRRRDWESNWGKETAHPERFDPTEKIKITDAERKQAETMRGDLSKSLKSWSCRRKTARSDPGRAKGCREMRSSSICGSLGTRCRRKTPTEP